MKKLAHVSLVQFFLYERQDIPITGNTVFIGHNGCGKSTLLDAVQIVLMGVNQHHLSFNAQAIGRGKRSVRDYCLGVTLQDGIDGKPARAREAALSYITLTFRDEANDNPVTMGVCLSARADTPKHEVEGLFVINGRALAARDMLETVENDSFLPMSWKDFEQSQRTSAKREGYIFEVAANSKDFIKKYLHHLQDRKRPIDFDPYLPTLKESLQLRYTDDIDGFVRHHLIAPNPIDIAKCSRQIRDFEELRQIVEDIERKITELSVLETRFRQVREAAELAASSQVVKARIKADDYRDIVEAGDHELRQTDDRLAELMRATDIAKEELELADAELRRVLLQIAQDPDARTRTSIEERIKEGQAALHKARTNLASRLKDLERTLRSLPGTLSLVGTPEHAEALELVQIALNEDDLTNADLDDITSKLVPVLEKAYEQADHRSRSIENAIEKNSDELSSLRGRLQNVERGGADLRFAGKLIDVLAARGIGAQPVCDLIQIGDATWQGAIEAFLGRNRESLIVEIGKEEAAIAVARTEGRQAAFDTTIVQPSHLERSSGTNATGYIGSLISGANGTAVNYARFIIGRMKMVTTNAELRENSRALTADGMLSANGGVRPLRLPTVHELMVGTRRDVLAADRIRADIARCHDTAQRLKNDREIIAGIKRHIAPMAGEEYIKMFFDLATERDVAIARMESLEESKNALTKGKVADLIQLEERTKRKVDRARERSENIKGDLSATRLNFDNITKHLVAVRSLLQEAENDQRSAADNILAKSQYCDEIYAQVCSIATTTSEKLRACEEHQKRSENDCARRAVSSVTEFRKYVERSTNQLGPEYNEWSLATTWVQDELLRLRDTALVERKAQAEEAKRLAEESFNKDVAVNLRDRIARMRIYLRSLDSILKKCPPFSNGERYRFEARVRDELSGVLEFIERSSGVDSPNLFENTELREMISKLLEDSARSDSGIDISDYRMFFRFDLFIEQDGKATGRLSSRMGSGSGGEHRTPLFVVAGAALATVFRIDVTHLNETFGLMLVDEAFYGMDPQNSLAVANFLTAIGLQIIMAGPDGDVSKFAPFCDRIYDMARFGDQIIMVPADITEPGRELMMSDMPAQHPELVEREIERITAA